MEETNKYYEFLEKCRDKVYIKTHIKEIKEQTSTEPFTSAMKKLILTKRNLNTLTFLHAINYPIKNLIPSLENKKNLNQYSYLSIYWMYKNGIITQDEFKNHYEIFSCIKNFDKMVDDIKVQYLMYVVELDRKKMKTVKEESCKILNKENEVDDLLSKAPVLDNTIYRFSWASIVEKCTILINVDSIFDISHLKTRESVDARSIIGSLRDTFAEHIPENVSNISLVSSNSDRGDEGNGICSYIDKIRIDNMHNFENSRIYHALDRTLSCRITHLYNHILGFQKYNMEIVILSRCSLPQTLAELTFFEYGCINLKNVFSMRTGKKEIYKNILSSIKGRVVIFDSECDIKNVDNVYVVDFDIMKDMLNNLVMKNAVY